MQLIDSDQFGGIIGTATVTPEADQAISTGESFTKNKNRNLWKVSVKPENSLRALSLILPVVEVSYFVH